MLERCIKGENEKENQKDEENKKVPNKVSNYNTLTQQELKQEIQKLKSEITDIKNNKDTNSSELQRKEEILKKLEQKFEENNNKNTNHGLKSNNNFSIGWVIGTVLLAIIGLTAFLVIKNNKKKKTSR